MNLLTQILLATLLMEGLLGGSLVLTLIKPRCRVWPPPGKNSWQFWYTWILTITSLTGVLALSILDWNTSFLTHWSHYVIGSIMMVGGVIFAAWGLKTLGVHSSLGLEGELVTEGPYRYSRNPQYVGDIIAILGFIILANSTLTWVTGVLGIFWFVLAPFTEEPWLHMKYGEAYIEYCKNVPRFL